MSDLLFYKDGFETPEKIGDPGLMWIKENVVGTSFIKLDNSNSGLLLYKDGYYPNISYAGDLALGTLHAWEASWEKPSCKACSVELVGWELRTGFCEECAVDILNNMDERIPVDEAEMRKPADAGYYLCPCSQVNVASYDFCQNCDAPMIDGVEVTLNVIEPEFDNPKD